MHCPKCGSEKNVKSGKNNRKQRYKCKDCGCNYTKEELGKVELSLKIQALKMYLEGMGFRSIGRVLGVSNVSVLKWIKIFGEIAVSLFENLNKVKLEKEYKKIELDEMWHYVKKKKINYGFGLLVNDEKQKLLIGLLELGEKKQDMSLKKS